jgi:hypothetical protein
MAGMDMHEVLSCLVHAINGPRVLREAMETCEVVVLVFCLKP